MRHFSPTTRPHFHEIDFLPRRVALVCLRPRPPRSRHRPPSVAVPLPQPSRSVASPLQPIRNRPIPQLARFTAVPLRSRFADCSGHRRIPVACLTDHASDRLHGCAPDRPAGRTSDRPPQSGSPHVHASPNANPTPDTPTPSNSMNCTARARRALSLSNPSNLHPQSRKLERMTAIPASNEPVSRSFFPICIAGHADWKE